MTVFKRVLTSGLLTSFILVISACGSTPQKPAPVEAEPTPAETADPEPAPPAATSQGIEPPPNAQEQGNVTAATPFRSKPAVIALLDRARAAEQSGDVQSAQSSLQRAQRIAPKDPTVYYQLANNHLQHAEYPLAEQVALKGLSVSGSDNAMRRKFWTLIADIRLAAGNPSGAEAAEQEARAL